MDPLRLPAIMCSSPSGGTPSRAPAGDVIEAWKESESNLLVIYGRPGAGKTWLLRDTVAAAPKRNERGPRVVPADFDLARDHLRTGHLPPAIADRATPRRRKAGSGDLWVVDNFDPTNSITGEQTASPDLTALAPILQLGCRAIVATRRSPEDGGDELNRQLANTLRTQTLGASGAWLTELLPWTIDELSDHAANVPTLELDRTVAYIRGYSDLLSDEFRRPLMIRMLCLLSDKLIDARPLSVAEVYDDYVSWALTVDYDRQHSAFLEAHKRGILENIAYDIFSGQPGTRVATYAVSHTRLAERVMEAVAQDPSVRSRVRTATYEWTDDFLATNHILTSSEVHFPVGSREYSFAHPSFFEYFVARAILARLRAESSLGIRPEALSEATFRSMALRFVREYWSSTVETAISAIAQRRLSWPDRLLLLYTMETTDEFGDLLQHTDPSYFEDLKDALEGVKSEFIRKAIKYQLVVVGEMSPFDYVTEVEQVESAPETATERWLLRTSDSDLTTALLHRLDRPALQRATPIAIYRLGQMGSVAAIPRLRQIATDDKDVRTRELAFRAIEQIEARSC